MKLTAEQIDQLYAFTIKHYVEYYDLQTELVDHLANAIEQQWQENPKLSFEEALQIEFKKFGIFGFMDVVEKRQLALTKKYKDIVWGHLKAFYTIPKIFGTLVFIWAGFNFLKFFNNVENFILYIISVLLVLFVIGLIIRGRIKQKQFKRTGKKWMFDQILSGYGSIFFGSNLFLQIGLRFFQGSNNVDFILWFGSFTIVTFVLYEYIVLFLIPSKAEQYLKETYPEYELCK